MHFLHSALKKFLSTPSARRATPHHLGVCFMDCISIHALREEGDGLTFCLLLQRKISIHALREEGDEWGQNFTHQLCISIHALREEGDPCPVTAAETNENFYPRPPRGGRLSRIRYISY